MKIKWFSVFFGLLMAAGGVQAWYGGPGAPGAPPTTVIP